MPEGETQSFPPHSDCHFYGRRPEDIAREQKELVYDVLDSRPLSRKEEGAIKEVAQDIIEMALARHQARCEKDRSKEELDRKKDNRDWLSIVISILSFIGMVVFSIIAMKK